MCISCPPITQFFYSLMLHTVIQLRKDLVVERSFDKNMSLNNFLNSNFCPIFMRSCNFSLKETILVRNSPTNKNNVTKSSRIIISKFATQGIHPEFSTLNFYISHNGLILDSITNYMILNKAEILMLKVYL